MDQRAGTALLQVSAAMQVRQAFEISVLGIHARVLCLQII